MTFPRPIVAAFFLFAASAAPAQPFTAEEKAQVDAIVAKALASTGIPSASVAVVRDGKIAFARAYGTQSPTIRQARTEGPYHIASISKQFTAAAILLLEDQGRLSLDDKVAQHLPGISGGEKITIRQLLSHTSGLSDYWPQDFSLPDMAKPVTPQQIVDRWAKKKLDFEPGTQVQYSNTGYVVAGLIAEKVSGQPLLAFMQQNIFHPIGMKVFNQDLAIGKDFPAGYRRAALGPIRVEIPAAPGWLYAAGQLAMSAPDLARWNIARIDRELLPPDDWAEREKPVRLADGSATTAGLGVFVGDGGRRVEHGGEAAGFLSENIVFPERKAAITVLVNGWFGNAQGEIAEGIEKMLEPAAADETAAARDLYAQLRSGKVDRARLTANAAYFFTPEVLKDYRDSLSALGDPTGFVLNGRPRLRGGFVARSYTVTFPDRKLRIATFAEPGETGRWEQFLVYPAS